MPFLASVSISVTEAALRLLAAGVAGAAVGVERQRRGRPAGLRTTMVTCVAAAAAMLFAQILTPEGTSRVAQGVITGIGFLGAGIITREGTLVHGLTTAAVIWTSTVLGLLFGVGLWAFGGMGVVLVLLILVPLRLCEQVLAHEWHGRFVVTVQMAGITDPEIKQRLQAAGVKVKHVCLDYDMEAKQRKLTCEIVLTRRHLFQVAEQVMTDFTHARGVLAASWNQE
jgi:putative Mg2+ transporter-C (MgtC) family protein